MFDREPFTFRSKSSGYIAGVKECVSSRPPAGFAAYFGARPYLPVLPGIPQSPNHFLIASRPRCRRTDFESISWCRTTVPRPDVLPVRRLHRFRRSMIWYRECTSCAGFASRWSRRSPENARNSMQRHPLPLGRPGKNRSAKEALDSKIMAAIYVLNALNDVLRVCWCPCVLKSAAASRLRCRHERPAELRVCKDFRVAQRV